MHVNQNSQPPADGMVETYNAATTPTVTSTNRRYKNSKHQLPLLPPASNATTHPCKRNPESRRPWGIRLNVNIRITQNLRQTSVSYKPAFTTNNKLNEMNQKTHQNRSNQKHDGRHWMAGEVQPSIKKEREADKAHRY